MGGGTATGVDLNDGMLAVAAAAAAGTQPAIDWHRGDAAALPFPAAAFDVVCCQQGLQFFGDQAAALGEMRRVLSPAGRLAIAVWRPIEHNPAFVPFTEALERNLGTEAAAMLRSPFGAPDPARLRAMLTAAGFTGPRFGIAIISVRFPSAEEFLWREAASSPLAEPVGALDAAGWQALADDMRDVLAPHADDDGIVFPMQTWLVTAHVRPDA
jgi:SAM-dependent methyltransferase